MLLGGYCFVLAYFCLNAAAFWLDVVWTLLIMMRFITGFVGGLVLPVSIPAGHFGMGHGAGAHAPDEYYVIESTNPKVAGLVDATMGYADFLYQLAAIK